METSRVALIALVCVVFSSQKRISGAVEEMRVRRGDDVTLYCDCVWKSGFNVVWFRNSTHENQLPLVTAPPYILHGAPLRYVFMRNNMSKSDFLQIKKVTESDQGLYYCALHEKKFTSYNHLIQYRDVFHYGNRTTWLSLQNVAAPHFTVSPSTLSPCVSERSVSWKLVFGVCAVCVLLSSLLSSICVYCLCTNTTKGLSPHLISSTEVKPDHGERDQRSDRDEGDKVCYTSLDIKKLNKKRVQRSDFSIYSEVRTDRKRTAEEE